MNSYELAESSGTLVDLAYRRLRQQILSNELRPGSETLEAELAQALGMSRTPVREAIVRLEYEGLVEVIPRRGVRVVPITLRDIREINEVLGWLEVLAAEKVAARHLTPAQIGAFDAAVLGMDTGLERGDMIAWAKADFRFHALLIELCGNVHLRRTAQLYLDKAHRARLITMPLRKRPVYSNTNHAAVVEAIRRNDSETAREIHAAHKKRWSHELDLIVDRNPDVFENPSEIKVDVHV
jgi:DNA-binding GntR family transcriptional regulator